MLHRAAAGEPSTIKEGEEAVCTDFDELLQHSPSLRFLLPFVSTAISVLSFPFLTQLCNLIHSVMAPDQYPFCLAVGRAT